MYRDFFPLQIISVCAFVYIFCQTWPFVQSKWTICDHHTHNAPLWNCILSHQSDRTTERLLCCWQFFPGIPLLYVCALIITCMCNHYVKINNETCMHTFIPLPPSTALGRQYHWGIGGSRGVCWGMGKGGVPGMYPGWVMHPWLSSAGAIFLCAKIALNVQHHSQGNITHILVGFFVL